MKRGPKSAVDLAVVQGGFAQRPEPPPELDDREAAIWRDTVASEPVEFFATAALRNLLIDYCHHRASVEVISASIASFKPEWLKVNDGAKRYAGLLRMRELETRAAAAMATKLRLTNQSRYQPRAAASVARNTAVGFRPWET